MRLCTIVFWIFILGLQWNLVLAEKIGGSPLCDRIAEEGHKLTREQANTTVGPWVKGQYEEWNRTGTHDSFWRWFHRKWAPNLADSIIECKLSQMCSPVSCQFVTDKHDLQDQWSAYWTLESIVTFHNMAYEIRDANQQAWTSVQGNIDTLMAKFSDGSNIEAHKLKHDKSWKIASHVIAGVSLLLSALGVFTAAAMTLTDTAVFVAMSADEIRMIASSAGLFSSSATVALSFGTDVMGPKDYVHKVTNTLVNSQTQNRDHVMDRFDAYMLGLLSGNDSSLTDLVQKGGYVNYTSVLTPKHNEGLRRRWRASYISSIWNLERTYVVMADTRNCESDSRGFQGLRVCLEQARQYVFYIFSKSILREGTNHKALIRGPIGHSNLESETGFTLKDAVQASYVYSKRHGYSANSGAPEGSEDLMDSFFSPESAEEGGKAHGLFNIPILYSPGGQAISSINTRDNRNYPCMAARLPWTESNDQQRSLQSRDMEWTDNDPETMFQFLNATGFYQSGDWWGYCHGDRHHHGNHCRGNEKIDWTGKFGPHQYKRIRHPFKHCKARKGHANGFVGCERPNNNGYDKNKPGDCGGKHMMAEGIVASDAQWSNGTVLEADDTEEDEGELSDWTEEEDGGDDDDDEADSEQEDESRVRTSNDNTTGNTSSFHA